MFKKTRSNPFFHFFEHFLSCQLGNLRVHIKNRFTDHEITEVTYTATEQNNPVSQKKYLIFFCLNMKLSKCQILIQKHKSLKINPISFHISQHNNSIIYFLRWIRSKLPPLKRIIPKKSSLFFPFSPPFIFKKKKVPSQWTKQHDKISRVPLMVSEQVGLARKFIEENDWYFVKPS